MKKVILILCCSLYAFIASAQNYIDVVYLSNGSIVKGIIVEQKPSEFIKIQTTDKSIYVFQISDIEKMTKEIVVEKQDEQLPQKQTQHSNSGLARVKKVMGVELYIYSEPLINYTVVGRVSSITTAEGINLIGNALSDGIENIGNTVNNIDAETKKTPPRCLNMNERINAIVENAINKKMHKKKPIDFDAIIIDNDEAGILIKFE